MKSSFSGCRPAWKAGDSDTVPLQSARLARSVMTTADLTRIDSRPIPDGREEIRAFMVIWNESLRLESMLKHYRQLGVNRFFIVDGGSTHCTLGRPARAP